jgi:hypothetical protein
MRILRFQYEAQFLFELAQQQKENVSCVMGLSPRNENMSYNEILWWRAFSCIRPLEGRRIDLLEARTISIHAGKSPRQTLIDWFDKENDPDWRRERDLKIKKELEELEAKRRENGETS